MSGALRCDHCNVNVSRGNDAAEVNVEAVCEHEHIAGFEVRLDIFLVELSLLLIVDEDHDDVSLLCSFSGCVNLKSLSYSLVP